MVKMMIERAVILAWFNAGYVNNGNNRCASVKIRENKKT